MVEVRKIHGRKEDKDGKKANWNRWMLAAAASAALTFAAMPSCSNTEEGPIPIPPVATDGGTETSDGGAGGSDGGGCVPNPSPACFNNSFEVTLPAGSVTSVGELKVKMVGTSENGSGVEVAEFEILDSCGGHLRTETIMEGETKVYQVTGTNLELSVTATEVSITNPAATLNIVVRCLDGGVTDGGTTDSGTGGSDGGSGGDGGAGGMDSGTGGMDSGTGGDAGTGGMDSGTGGMDSGTGGMDSGTGGMDSGTGGDGGMGGMDAGGMDGGVTDGGTTDSGTGGTDGGVTDGGTTDSGTGGSDGGGAACATATTGNWSGNILNGANQTVGGYVFTYNGPDGSGNALISVTCDGNPTGSYAFPEDFTTSVDLPADGKRLKVTPHLVVPGGVNVGIQVVNYP